MNTDTRNDTNVFHVSNSPLFEALQRSEYELDAAQWRAAEQLMRLSQALMHFKQTRAIWLKRWLVPSTPPKGLYVWGGVGCGKSFLMDTFFQTLPYQRKRRVHFHALMQDVDRQFRRVHQEEDPMGSVVKKMAQKYRVLCIDEITIVNISDAMLFARLLYYLVEFGVVLVMTSNHPPSRLYEDGLHRDRFLKSIKLLESYLYIHHLDSTVDYRLQKLSGKPLWYRIDAPVEHFSSEKYDTFLETFFEKLTGVPPKPKNLKLLGRKLPAAGVGGTVLLVECRVLCGEGRTIDDYAELILTYHTILLSKVPVMEASRRDVARRFIWLIDVLYDARVLLIVTAKSDIHHLVTPDLALPEYERTVSRLLEMQSHAYQIEGYRPIHLEKNN